MCTHPFPTSPSTCSIFPSFPLCVLYGAIWDPKILFYKRSAYFHPALYTSHVTFGPPQASHDALLELLEVWALSWLLQFFYFHIIQPYNFGGLFRIFCSSRRSSCSQVLTLWLMSCVRICSKASFLAMPSFWNAPAPSPGEHHKAGCCHHHVSQQGPCSSDEKPHPFSSTQQSWLLSNRFVSPASENKRLLITWTLQSD